MIVCKHLLAGSGRLECTAKTSLSLPRSPQMAVKYFLLVNMTNNWQSVALR